MMMSITAGTPYMATIQAKHTNGHKYCYIVESGHVNGKPKPIVLSSSGQSQRSI
ncbi:hypothetical protein S225a_24290 [Candidatus Brocadiaceae bacterium S225]|nr:hypothetical protein S225a_24290 [Candidatus Brocadiaceae bacterium S225]